MRKVGLMVGLALVAIACATGADMVGEMMDSGVPDAGAQPGDGRQAHPVTCDRERVVTRTDTYEGTRTLLLVTTTKYALVDVPNVQDVGIERCDRIGSDYSGVWGCPPGGGITEYECTGQVSKPCSFAWGAGYHMGDTVVVDCESTSESTNRDGVTTTQRGGWGSVTLYY